MPYCENCGKQLPAGERFCSACGGVSDPSRQQHPTAAPRPPKGSPYAVVGSWPFVGSLLLLSIPVVGFILAIVWACGGAHNLNRRNLARAYLLLYAIGIVLALISVFVFGFTAETFSQIITY